MNHQSLYRKYRPQTFEDVVGQSHVTRTLRNAARDGGISHAYLFTGPRGTGKTTTARILAKALNCEKTVGGEPDATCAQCVDIAEGRHPDVYELDAASRTQVENVREEIIGRVAYAPSRGPYKVYIIDEVHMLSTHSFNALLKTLEEPPRHAVFVLCTTHPQKVPETIHSRCQRFDFRRISVEDIVNRLEAIAEAEGIEVAAGSLTLVARHALGGMRDAISTLEQLAAFTGKNIALADVEGLLGEVDTALLHEFSGIVAARDVGAGFSLIGRLVESGVDIGEFVKDATSYFRDLYVAASVGDATGIVDTTLEDLARLTTRALEFGSDRLARCLDVLGQLNSEIRWSSDPRLALEVALTRMARPESDLTLESLAERVHALECRVASGAPAANDAGPAAKERPAPRTPSSSPKSAAGPKKAADTPTVEPDASTAADTPAVEPDASKATGTVALDRSSAKRVWPAVHEEMRRIRSSRASVFDGVEVDVDADGNTLVIEFPAENAFAMRQAEEPSSMSVLKTALAKVWGDKLDFRFQLGRGAVRAAEPATPSTRIGVHPGPDDDAGSLPAESAIASEDVHLRESRLLADLGAEIVGEHPHLSE